MSYVRPSSLSADVSWYQQPSYTRLSGLVANASWFDGMVADSIVSTVFGTPTYSTNVVLAEAGSTNTTAFGTPIGSAHVVSSLPFSVFGAPKEGTALASSLPASTFGTPEGASFLRANRVSSKSYFGTPLALFVDRTCLASGFTSNFGTPYAGLFSAAQYNQIGKAGSVLPAAFGAPSSPVERQGSAAPFISTRFGRPSKGVAPLSAFGAHRAFSSYPAQSLPAASFGEHAVEMTHRASSAPAATFGEPSAQRVERATTINRTRFGVPTSDMAGVHRTYGFRRSWFGNHRSLRDISMASGWQSARFGEPACTEVHRTLHIPPEHKFGTPLLKRVA